jgi:hypothetical protein
MQRPGEFACPNPQALQGPQYNVSPDARRKFLLGGGINLQAAGINVCGLDVDKNQSIRWRLTVNLGRYQAGIAKFFRVVLELLGGCGMIWRARLLTSPTDGRCRRLLNIRVHYSSVIFSNGLNLSGGSRV